MPVSLTRPAERIASCGDVSCEFLVDPIPRPRPQPLTITLRPEKQQVVFVDSRKPNSLVILRRAQQLLRDRGVDVEDEILQKRSAGVPMDEQTLDRLALEGGLILSGVND
jgi:hypothetical protein